MGLGFGEIKVLYQSAAPEYVSTAYDNTCLYPLFENLCDLIDCGSKGFGVYAEALFTGKQFSAQFEKNP